MADDKDDLLNPDEIEALLNAHLGPGPAVPLPRNAGDGGAGLSRQDLDAMLRQPSGSRSGRPSRDAAAGSADMLLNQVEADLAAALAPNMKPGLGRMEELGGIHEYDFHQFDDRGDGSSEPTNLDLLQEVELDLRIELGRTELLIEEVLKLREGSVVPLDKLAGDPVDILVNGRLVARGEVLVLNDNFCVRVAEIVSPTF